MESFKLEGRVTYLCYVNVVSMRCFECVVSETCASSCIYRYNDGGVAKSFRHALLSGVLMLLLHASSAVYCLMMSEEMKPTEPVM